MRTYHSSSNRKLSSDTILDVQYLTAKVIGQINLLLKLAPFGDQKTVAPSETTFSLIRLSPLTQNMS